MAPADRTSSNFSEQLDESHKMIYRYRLHYLADHDDADPRFYESATEVTPGEVLHLPETGWYHRAIRLHTKKTGIRLDVSKRGESVQEAMLLSEQYGHWTAQGR